MRSMASRQGSTESSPPMGVCNEGLDGSANDAHTAAMTTLVRPATVADAPRLSQLGATTFRETFERENTPEDMARYVSEAFTPERQAAETSDPGGTVLLAERRGTSGDAEDA